MHSFVDTVQLTAFDPLSPWNVRHSAAVAIGISGLLKLDDRRSGAAAAYRRRRSFDLFMVCVKFLDDDDADVRRAAGRALLVQIEASSSRTTSSNTEEGEAAAALSTVPLASLERARDALCAKLSRSEQQPEPELLLHLFTVILYECRDVQADVDAAEREFAHSAGGGDGDIDLGNLLNVGSSRKIFEDEEPNPFEEKLLTCQLAASALVSAPPVDETLRNHRNLCDVTERIVESSLKFVQSLESFQLGGKRVGGVVHDVSWVNGVLPRAHGLLMGSIAAIYLGLGNVNDDIASDLANAVARVLGADAAHAQCLHPRLLQALQVLSRAERDDGETRDALLRCCFLLPTVGGARGRR